MSGTKAGGIAARDTNLEEYGEDFYARIGSIGGKKGKADGTIKGFALMDKEKVRKAGRKGGSISRRPSEYEAKEIKDRTQSLNPQEFDSVIPKKRWRLW